MSFSFKPMAITCKTVIDHEVRALPTLGFGKLNSLPISNSVEVWLSSAKVDDDFKIPLSSNISVLALKWQEKFNWIATWVD